MDTRNAKKFSFTFVDMLIIFLLAVGLYFMYYRTPADVGTTPGEEETKTFSVVCKSDFPHGEYVGKIAKYDTLFSSDGTVRTGDVEEVRYESTSTGGVTVILTLEITGDYHAGDTVFVNTDSFCGDFTVVYAMEIKPPEIL